MLKDFSLPWALPIGRWVARIYKKIYLACKPAFLQASFADKAYKKTDKAFFILVLLQLSGLYFRFGKCSIKFKSTRVPR
jgi:hypothetical protein